MADETIIVTPATPQSLPFESEGNAGNTDENFRETFAVEDLRRYGRLEDSVGTGDKLGAIADATGDYRASRRVDPLSMAGTAARPTRIEDGAVRGQRVSE